MGLGLGRGMGQVTYGEGYRSNSPTMAYETAYGKKPSTPLFGMSGTPRREWRGMPVDADLKDEWLESLNNIPGVEIRSTEQGKSPERIAHAAFRLKNPNDDKRAAEIVKRLNKIPGVQAKTDMGAQGRPRIMVVGKTWKGQKGWESWWDTLSGKIQEAVNPMNKKGSLLSDMILKEGRVLSARGRKQVAKKNFAMPASAAVSGEKQKGSYPIHDKAHARSALTYGKRYLSVEDFKKLKARVYTKYPSLNKTGTLFDITKEARKAIRPLSGIGKTPGMHRRINNLQKGVRVKRGKVKTPLLNGIKKQAANKLMWSLGAFGAGALGVPWFKKKYMGVYPETLQQYEQGDPNYGVHSPRMPFNPYLNRIDLNNRP